MTTLEHSNKQGVINLIKFHLSTAVWKLNGAGSMNGSMLVQGIKITLQVTSTKITASINNPQAGIIMPYLLVADGDECRALVQALFDNQIEEECGKLLNYLNRRANRTAK